MHPAPDCANDGGAPRSGIGGRKRAGSSQAVSPIARRVAIRSPLPAALVLGFGLALASHAARAEQRDHRPIIHLTGSERGFDRDLAVVCPQDGSGEPRFLDRASGRTFGIADAPLRAVARKTCELAPTSSSSGEVIIDNQTGSTLYVGFSPQSGASITWGGGCLSPIKGLTVKILKATTCKATVTDSVANPGSRFCAASTIGPTGLDCAMAQQNHQTLIEPYFEPAPCFGAGSSNCIWYDISVIPAHCTDDTPYGSKNSDWHSDYCAATGGASYNLPVTISCAGQAAEPTFTCQGPPFATGKLAAAGYPRRCGNPSGRCIGGARQQCTNGVEAYFYPMSVINANHQPVGVCPGGQSLVITFLAGP
jgi:hypothetical protein